MGIKAPTSPSKPGIKRPGRAFGTEGEPKEKKARETQGDEPDTRMQLA